jgi:glycerol-3-phosphate acyltransferase PlsY
VNPYILSVLLIVAAYLIGAIPFGYVIALRLGGIDIRTVGSGNIGATNVGRVLGFRFFVLVFTLDLLKGFLPTLVFPRLLAFPAEQGGAAAPSPTLGVLVALATILGHNFPVYLRFRGGKGVATSLGALLALDAPAALASAAGFGVSLWITRYVSVSSLIGGLVFTVVHFARVRDPFGRGQIAMSVVTIGLLILLIFRHRKNLARVRAGTEPRVSLGKRKPPPAGRIAWVLVAGLAGLGVVVAATIAASASKRATLRLGQYTLAEVARVSTGYQRAERLTFADRGRLLAVTCPRYNRVVLYRVTGGETPGLDLHADIALEGRPVAVCPAEDRFYVLERPRGDACHLEPGFWETYDFKGRRIGSRFQVGFYPDDLAIMPDRKHALVLTSGSAEGGANKPAPALVVIALGPDAPAHREVGRVAFDRPGADPERLELSESGRQANVVLVRSGSDQAATIDLTDLSRPFVAGESSPVAIAREGDAVRLDLPELGGCLARTRPGESRLDLFDAASLRPLGNLPLRGAMNLSPTRPTGIAHAPGRELLAVASYSGSVHLIAIRPGQDRNPPPVR